VFQRNVTVVVGLPVGFELPAVPVRPLLRGRVRGPLPAAGRAFVRLVGVYSNRSMESGIADDGSFEVSVPEDGKYLLLVISDQGVLASRVILAPCQGPARGRA
jgi:hypothetical protein